MMPLAACVRRLGIVALSARLYGQHRVGEGTDLVAGKVLRSSSTAPLMAPLRMVLTLTNPCSLHCAGHHANTLSAFSEAI